MKINFDIGGDSSEFKQGLDDLIIRFEKMIDSKQDLQKPLDVQIDSSKIDSSVKSLDNALSKTIDLVVENKKINLELDTEAKKREDVTKKVIETQKHTKENVEISVKTTEAVTREVDEQIRLNEEKKSTNITLDVESKKKDEINRQSSESVEISKRTTEQVTREINEQVRLYEEKKKTATETREQERIESIYAQTKDGSFRKEIENTDNIAKALIQEYALRKKLYDEIRANEQIIQTQNAKSDGNVDFEKLRKAQDAIKDIRYEAMQADADFQVLAQALTGMEDFGGAEKFVELQIAIEESKNEAELLNKTVKIYEQDSNAGLDKTKESARVASIEMKTLTTRFREVRDELAKMDASGERATNPERFQQLSKEANDLKTSIDRANYSIDSMAKGAGLKRAILGFQEMNALAGVLTGTMALFGIENENVMKTLTRLNALMTISNSLQTLSTTMVQKDSIARRVWAGTVTLGTRALQGFRGALLATGIGAMAVAVGYLIAKLMEYNDATKKASEETEALKQKQIDFGNEVSNLASKELVDLQKNINAINNLNLSNEKRIKSIDDIKKAYPKVLENLSNEEILAGKVGDAYDKMRDSIINASIAEAFRKQATDQIEVYTKKVGELALKHGDNFDIVKNTADYYADNTYIDEAIKKEIERNGILSGNLDVLLDASELKKVEISALTNSNRLLDIANSFQSKITKEIKDGEKSSGMTVNHVTEYIDKLMEIEKSTLFEQLEDGLEKSIISINDKYQEQLNKLEDIKAEMISLGKYTKEQEDRVNAVSSAISVNWSSAVTKVISEYTDGIFQLQAELEKDIFGSTELEVNAEQYDLAISEIDDALNKISKLREIYMQDEEKHSKELGTLAQQEVELFKKQTEVTEYFTNRQNELIEDEYFTRYEFTKKQIDLQIKLFGDSEDITNQQIALLDTLAEHLGVSADKIKEYLKSGGGVSVADFFQISEEEAQKLIPLINEAFVVIDREVDSKKGMLERSGGTLGGLFGVAMANAMGDEMTEKLEAQFVKMGNQIASHLNSIMGSFFDAQKAMAETERNMIDSNINRLQEAIEAEKQAIKERENMYEEGMATSYEIDNSRLDSLEEALLEEEKLKEENANKIIEIEMQQAKASFAIQMAQQAMSTVTAISSLISGSAQAMSAHAGIPFIGVALGIASAGAMIASFIAFRKQLSAMQSSVPGFEKGGVLSLDGKGQRHSRGGIGLYGHGGRKIAEYEEGETIYAINRKQSSDKTTMPLLDALNIGDYLSMQVILDTLTGSESKDVVNNIEVQVNADDGSRKGIEKLVSLQRGRREYFTKNGKNYYRIGNKTILA